MKLYCKLSPACSRLEMRSWSTSPPWPLSRSSLRSHQPSGTTANARPGIDISAAQPPEQRQLTVNLAHSAMPHCLNHIFRRRPGEPFTILNSGRVEPVLRKLHHRGVTEAAVLGVRVEAIVRGQQPGHRLVPLRRGQPFPYENIIVRHSLSTLGITILSLEKHGRAWQLNRHGKMSHNRPASP